MPRFRVISDGLNVRSEPVKEEGNVLVAMPRGTEFDRGELSPDGRWAKVEVVLVGKIFNGWCSTSAEHSAEVDDGGAAAALDPALFNVQRRRAYVNSVLQNRDKFNFLRPARQAWDDGRWLHSFEDGGQTFRVAASWNEATKGNFVIVSPTRPGGAFDSEKATFCNFNITFCYHEAYGGPSLQFMDGEEHSANRLVDKLQRRWKVVDSATAARIANAGGFVIAGRKATGHGHVVFLLEGSDPGGDPSRIRTFHVGGGVPRERTVTDIWSAPPVYVTPPDTFAAWKAANP
jgi:hypothetical protein